jgi:hypothetical protein
MNTQLNRTVVRYRTNQEGATAALQAGVVGLLDGDRFASGLYGEA